MSREPLKCTILDDDGNPHEYLIVPHKASEGLVIGSRLVALAGPVLAGLVGKMLGGGKEPSILGALDSDIDLGAAAAGLAEAIGREDVAGLVKKLLGYCHRDGQALSGTSTFESAYVANYGEIGRAIAMVLEHNRFHLFFRGIGGKMGTAGEHKPSQLVP